MSRVSPRHILMGVFLVGALSYLGFVVKTTSPSSADKSDKTPTAETGDTATLDLSIPPDPAFSRYEKVVERNIFAPPGAAAPKKKKKKVPPPPPLPSGKKKSKPKPPAKPDLSGWSYVGWISLNGERIALLQNEANDSMKKLPEGAEFMGAKVKSIGATKLVLSSPGGDIQLSVPRDYPVVPLDKNASGKQPRMMRRPPGPRSAEGRRRGS